MTVSAFQGLLAGRFVIEREVGRGGVGIVYRALDHQSTMGAYVGRIGVRAGKGIMTDWRYANGADYLPGDAEIKKLRPPE